jgi:hypothetical protein
MLLHPSKAVFLLFLNIGVILPLAAQKQKAFLEIGGKKIFFEIENKVGVYRTVTDTIVKCKGTGLKNFPLGQNFTGISIPPSEIKVLSREVFNDHGCIWTRVTNDVVVKDNYSPNTYVNFLNDSTNEFIRPSSCFRHDTVMQIDPITLGEDIVVQVDSVSKAKFNVGLISKSDLAKSVLGQFNLDANGLNLRLKSLTLGIFNEKCDWLVIDYNKQGELDVSAQKIRNMPAGSTVIIEWLHFADTNGRIFSDDGLSDMALMQIGRQ